MKALDKYLIFSSIFALFTEDFNFHYIIDWKLFYLILLINYVLLASKYRLTVSTNLLLILIFLLLHGLIAFTLLSNPIQSLMAQILGIAFSSIFYYNFLKIYGSNTLFEAYLEMAFWVAVLSIPMYLLNINSFSNNRLNGIMSEAAHYATIMLPAVYLFLRRKNYFKLSIVIITIFLSKSSVGFIGLALILILPLIKIKYFLKFSWIVLIILGLSWYYLSLQWNRPVDENNSNTLVRRLKETTESLEAVYTGKFQENTNLSTYAFLSNGFIVTRIFTQHPLGTGLGSYPYEYDKYYPLLTPPNYLETLKLSKINRTDANSLFLRMLADLGIFSILIIFYFIFRTYNLFIKDDKTVQQSTFFYLLVKLIREGHYFPPEFYFFLLIFLKDFDKDITHS